MIIHNFEQGSEEWLQYRVGKVTGKSSEKVMSNNWVDYTDVIAAEQITNKRKSEGFKSEAMKRGNELEPVARRLYSELLGLPVQEVGFIQPEQFPYFGMSPDGLVSSNGQYVIIPEIKCPEPQTHIRYIRENVAPKEYYWQYISAFVACKEIFCVDFISYCPEITNKPIWVKRINRKDVQSDINALEAKLTIFFTQVQKTINLITF
jgi:hypothetical protein